MHFTRHHVVYAAILSIGVFLFRNMAEPDAKPKSDYHWQAASKRNPKPQEMDTQKRFVYLTVQN